MPVTRRYIGDAVIALEQAADGTYNGTISAGGRVWKFAELRAPRIRTQGDQFSEGYDAPAAYDAMANSACSFGSYYTTYNRSADDLPDWAPDAETADAINAATEWATTEEGSYIVRRSRKRAA